MWSAVNAFVWSRTPVIKTNAFFAAIASVLVMKFKALEQLIFVVVVQPRCVVGPRVSPPAYFKVDRGQVAVYAYVHGHTRTHWPQSTQSTWGISSKTLSTSSLTINAPLIVKDEVDKVFELILFVTKQKIYVGLKAYCYLGPASSRGLEGPRDRGSMITILIE